MSAPHLDSWAVRSTETATSPAGEGAVALSITEQKYFVLNDTAAAIWARLQSPITLRRLRDEIVAEFGVGSEEAGDAVLEFVARLADLNIVKIQDQAFAP